MDYSAWRAALVMICMAAAPAFAQTPAPDTENVAELRQQIAVLRTEFETVRRQYDERLTALEQQLAGLTPSSPPEPPAAATTPAAPASVAGGDEAANLPLPTPAVPSRGKIFNPDIAVVGNVLGAVGSNDVESSPALALEEAEASFQAVIDPYARADFFFAFGPEGAEVEEGFITFNNLPGGLLLKAGKMRAAFGKVNALHPHTLPWTDRPLMTRNLLGGDEGLSDGGISVSKLILNPFLFLEATGEIYGGESEVFAGDERADVSYVGRLRGYRDLTEDTNIDLGASFAWGQSDLEADATRRLLGVDATFRFRPLRRAMYQRLMARAELIWSREDLAGSEPTSFGLYAGGEYQFSRRWFAGGRWDYAERRGNPDAADKGAAATLTFWPSEFSQIRAQYRHTRYAEDISANELLFQFLFSIGAHGAHAF